MSPNGRHPCAICQTEILHWDMDCPNPRCGVPAEVAQGQRDLTAEEIIKRNMETKEGT